MPTMPSKSTQSYQLIETNYRDKTTDLSDFNEGERLNISSSPLVDNDDLEKSLALQIHDSFTPRSHSILFTFITTLRSFFFHVFIYLEVLLPSFITNIWHPQPAKKLSPTAYLNGVRGVAAYSVFWQHFMTEFYLAEPNWAWHARPPPQDRWLIQFPFLSLTHSGFFPVTTFFALSGFVLSYGPLRYVRSHNCERLLKNLSSSCFRRGMRLFLPCITPLVFAAICIYMDVYNGHFFFGHRQPMLWTNLRDAWGYWEGLVNFLDTTGFRPPSDTPLYTLPVEFKGSILVFVCVLGLSRVKPWLRMSLLACLCYYSLSKGAWETFLFLAGIILAEMRHIREDPNFCLEHLLKDEKRVGYARRTINAFWVLIFITSLYTASIPVMDSLNAPGFRTLASWTPRAFQASDHLRAAFWCSISSIALILSLENFSALQRPFASRLVQYLGDISFSLYVFHVPIILSIGRYVTQSMMDRCTRAGWDASWGWIVGGYFVVTPILVWVSDVQWRFVDEGSVRFARWVEGWMVVEDGQ